MQRMCPRCEVCLVPKERRRIRMELCARCGGEWLGRSELERLEALAVPDPDALRGTIEYLPRPSHLHCPVCRSPMVQFDYRAGPLELEACGNGHGYWLDGGKERLVKGAMRQRARDLHRAARAESSFYAFLEQLRRQNGTQKRP
jgi:Zn-finger nucleic acid-binding protein